MRDAISIRFRFITKKMAVLLFGSFLQKIEMFHEDWERGVKPLRSRVTC